LEFARDRPYEVSSKDTTTQNPVALDPSKNSLATCAASMAFRVEISLQAERDAEQILEWLLSQRSGPDETAASKSLLNRALAKLMDHTLLNMPRIERTLCGLRQRNPQFILLHFGFCVPKPPVMPFT
jgi:plasmid stabilization system protein ParE